MSEMRLGDLRVMPIDDVRPYWRNPRRVTEESVNMLRRSIEEYGYQQPIVVDEDMVIVVGHTRYAALRRMGVTEVPVMVASTLTPAQVKQYRLIDNRAAELTSWNYETLMDEVAGLDSELMRSFFPEVGAVVADPVEAEDAALKAEWDRVDTRVGFTCPSCFHSWETEVTKAAIMAGVIKAEVG